MKRVFIALAATAVLTLALVGVAAPASAQHRDEVSCFLAVDGNGKQCSAFTPYYSLEGGQTDRSHLESRADVRVSPGYPIHVGWTSVVAGGACPAHYEDIPMHLNYLRIFNGQDQKVWEVQDLNIFDCQRDWNPDLVVNLRPVTVKSSFDVKRTGLPNPTYTESIKFVCSDC